MTAEAKPATFDPSGHFTDLKGKQYLGARWRLKWLRTDHPDWTVQTSIVELDFDKGYGIVRAEILNEQGRLIANALKTETRKDFFDFLEKAETGAIGRACAVAGYGTEDALDLDEGEAIADAPVQARPQRPQRPQNAAPPRPPAPTPIRSSTAVPEPDEEDIAALQPAVPQGASEPIRSVPAPFGYPEFRELFKGARKAPTLGQVTGTAADMFPGRDLEMIEPKGWKLSSEEWRALAARLAS